MKIASRIVFAFALALPAFGCALAAEEDTLIERSMPASGQVLNYVQGVRPVAQQSAVDRVRAHRANEAQAYVPYAGAYETNDFGAGSQR